MQKIILQNHRRKNILTIKHEDLIFKDITEFEKDVFLKKLGIKSKIKILNPTEIRFMDAQTLIAPM